MIKEVLSDRNTKLIEISNGPLKCLRLLGPLKGKPTLNLSGPF